MAHSMANGSTPAAVRAIDQYPQRPSMPTAADQARSSLTGTRFEILNELWDDALREWMEEHVDEDRLLAWGPPDTSVNPLVDLCRQLSTPGLYGRHPEVSHQLDAADPLIDPDGLLDQAGLWTKLQQVQYFAIGLGDFLLRVDALENRLAFRLVAPQNVYAVSDDDLPDVPVELWELRLRWWDDREEWVWVWDQFKIADEASGGVPTYRTILASDDPEEEPIDVSEVFLGPIPFVGEAYPFRDEHGTPLIPYSWYRSQDAGLLWNSNAKRGATRGTLNAALNWTYAQHAARDASGSTIFAVGVEEPSVSVRRDAENNRKNLRTITLTPGAMVFLRQTEGASPQFFQSGPGANLDSVSAYASLYEQKQAVRWGLNPSDLTRMSSNPMSGAAMFVSTKGRREYARQVEPLFRRADLETIRIASALSRRRGLGAFPSMGYTITYAEIPESPAEQKERRDQITWEQSSGYLSPLDGYQRLHPGASNADAFDAMVQAELDVRRLAKAVADQASAEGLPTLGDLSELDGVESVEVSQSRETASGAFTAEASTAED